MSLHYVTTLVFMQQKQLKNSATKITLLGGCILVT